ncbi:MAG: TIGR01777 family oxidoreductase [Ignavibacteria bacterium]|nr:TIGR01777 family oxidoreductase [Ignavibacteria bacterium]
MDKKMIAINGATGLIGKNLTMKLIAKGYRINVLTRRTGNAKKSFIQNQNIVYTGFSGEELTKEMVTSLNGSYGIINLAGASIGDRRWNDKYKKLIYDSRINSTRLLVDAMSKITKKPSVFINASASGYYGLEPVGESDEYSEPGDDFLSKLVADWEAEALKANELQIRTGIVRTGVVLSRKGGALERMITPFKYFAGGHLGNGKQWIPWIHIEDLTELFIYILENQNMAGVYNGIAPCIITNKKLAKAIGNTLGRPYFFPVPEFILKLLVGEFAKYLLEGRKIIPKRTLESGFKFIYTDIETALSNILKNE